MGDKFVKTQLDDLTGLRRNRLLAAVTRAMAEFTEHLARLLQAQNQFTPVIG